MKIKQKDEWREIMNHKENKSQYSSPYDFYGKIPLGQAIILGLQHVLAMFVGKWCI